MIENRFPYPTAQCSAYGVYDERYWLDLKHNPMCEKNAAIVVLGTKESFDRIVGGFLKRESSFEELLKSAEQLDVLRTMKLRMVNGL
jgi:hypothetical protein